MALNDGAESSTSAEYQHTVSDHISSLTFHRDESTFLTTGSSPACETVTEEVALFVLAAHRTSGITGRRGALVRNIYTSVRKQRQTERERSVNTALKSNLYKQDVTMRVTLYSHQTEEGHLLCSAYQEFNINSLMLAKLSTGDALIPSFPAYLSSQKIKWKFIHLLFFVCPVFLSNNFT